MLLTGIVLVLGAAFYFIVYPLWLSPMAKVPGPRITALTRYWILYKTWNEQRIELVHKLHEKYGCVVRLSPNEVSVSDGNYVKVIYGGNYDKSGFYGQYGNYGHTNTFSSLKRQPHINRRRIMASLYSKSSVDSAGVVGMTQARVRDLMAYIRSHAPQTDVYNLYHAMAMDTVTGFIWGDKNGTSLLRSGAFGIIEKYRLQSATWFWTTLMPRLWDLAVSRKTKAAINTAAEWHLDHCRQSTAGGEAPGSVLERLAAAGIRGLDAYSESADHTAAGHETTGTTLTYLTWYLSRHPEIQDKLRAELLETFPAGSDPESLDFKILDKLPYLNGVVMETLRLYSAIPGAEPRIVPAKGVEIDDVFIPGGTIISCQPYTLHRDMAVYFDALDFDPERWYRNTPARLRLMHRNFMAFGAGVRMCIGMNLALQEIKLVVANIYLNYRTQIPSDFDDRCMAMADKYTSHPVGHRLPVIFTPVS